MAAPTLKEAVERYILENTTVKSDERFYGDHYPAFLERKEYAWNYSKEEADKKIIELGDKWKAISTTQIITEWINNL